MSDVVDRLARIETKLDRVLVDIPDHEKRLRRIETRVAVWSGSGSMLGLLIGWYAKAHLGG